MEGKRRRLRLAEKPKPGMPVVEDVEAFIANRSSAKARIVTAIDERIGIELFFDKHYLDRHQHGDNNGVRVGIEKESVETLVLTSIKHLMFYSAVLERFNFLNHSEIEAPNHNGIKIVCRQSTDNGTLNVVIQAHYIDLNKYEVTVITAMCVDEFRIFDNQFVLDMYPDGSTLSRMVNKALREVYKI